MNDPGHDFGELSDLLVRIAALERKPKMNAARAGSLDERFDADRVEFFEKAAGDGDDTFELVSICLL